MSTPTPVTSTEFSWPIRVYYEDTDASGVAYHANYLRWFERGRTEWLRALGYGQEQLRASLDLAFTLASLEIRYLRPARLDDELVVGTRVAVARRASIVFAQVLRRADGSGEVLSEAKVRAACVSAATFRPVALPDGLFEKAC